MAWRRARGLREVGPYNAFARMSSMEDTIVVDRHGRPVFVYCPTIDMLSQIFRNEMGLDVQLNSVRNVEDAKKALKRMEEHRAELFSQNSGFDVFDLYKESAIRAVIFQIERILARIKMCETESCEDSKSSIAAARSAVLVFDFLL